YAMLFAVGTFFAGGATEWIWGPRIGWPLFADNVTWTSAFLCILFYFGCFWLWSTQQPGHAGKLDWSVDNTIVGFDRETGSYLVAAANTHKIEGDGRHVPGNLPANIWFYSRGLYVVDPHHQFGSPGSPDSVENKHARGELHYETIPNGPWEIVPRGAGKNWSG